MQGRLIDGPELVHWVARVDSVYDIDDPLELSRGGKRWVIGVARDGRMPLGGLAPSRILWRTPPPSTALPDKRIRLRQLSLSTPQPAALTAAVADVRGPMVVTNGPSGLSATFDTPSGCVELGHLQ